MADAADAETRRANDVNTGNLPLSDAADAKRRRVDETDGLISTESTSMQSSSMHRPKPSGGGGTLDSELVDDVDADVEITSTVVNPKPLPHDLS